MRRWIISVFLLSGLLWATDAVVAAQKLGVESQYSVALKKAQEQKRMLVMIIVKKHCRWCNKLIDRTLQDRDVKRTLDEEFVTLIIDKDADYPKAFRENFFPSMFFIDAKTQKSVYENIGYINAKTLLNDLHEAKQLQKTLYSD